MIDGFGLDRCVRCTDWTRTIQILKDERGVMPFRNALRLSVTDKAELKGATLQQGHKW